MKVHFTFDAKTLCGRDYHALYLQKSDRLDEITCKKCRKILQKQLDAESKEIDRLIQATNAAITVHPETGEKAPDGWTWAKTIFGNWFVEPIGTPYTASPRSETYWCS